MGNSDQKNDVSDTGSDTISKSGNTSIVGVDAQQANEIALIWKNLKQKTDTPQAGSFHINKPKTWAEGLALQEQRKRIVEPKSTPVKSLETNEDIATERLRKIESLREVCKSTNLRHPKMKKLKRFRKCGNCDGCNKQSNCGRCQICLDKNNKNRGKCLMRRCHRKIKPISSLTNVTV